ncbi:MAG: transposase [Verrucomicrobiales bacterium]|nr:transposase [Verrucomicrobiales bacterium]MDF1756661.1 transposase [Verrucomicrobiales bacterium]
MSSSRLIGEGRSFYHCIGRCVDRGYFFREAVVKEECRKIMRRLEKFLHVRVITYCWMSNHTHLLLEIPDRQSLEPLTEESLLELLPTLYGANKVAEVREELKRIREQSSSAEVAEKRIGQILAKYEARRCDLSIFMKELNQRVTRYINRRNNRSGTLWEKPFTSVLVEGNQGALLAMAAYIDLNPVRAGMVEKPEDYRWSGYAEAVGGSQIARKGLGIILSEALVDRDFKSDWRRTQNRYRVILYTDGQEVEANLETGERGRKGFHEDEVEKVVAIEEGAMSIPEVLRHRVRYFSDGAVLGSAAFVNRVFERERSRFGPRRQDGARRMRGANWGSLRVLRDLRKNVIA